MCDQIEKHIVLNSLEIQCFNAVSEDEWRCQQKASVFRLRSTPPGSLTARPNQLTDPYFMIEGSKSSQINSGGIHFG